MKKISGLEALILGHEPLLTETTHLYFIDAGFIISSNQKTSLISHDDAQSFLKKNGANIDIKRLKPSLIYR